MDTHIAYAWMSERRGGVPDATVDIQAMDAVEFWENRSILPHDPLIRKLEDG
jgi:hypothetical protein